MRYIIGVYYELHTELGVTMEGAALIEAKFTGNSVLVPFKGQRRLTIHSLDEVIIIFVS